MECQTVVNCTNVEFYESSENMCYDCVPNCINCTDNITCNECNGPQFGLDINSLCVDVCLDAMNGT